MIHGNDTAVRQPTLGSPARVPRRQTRRLIHFEDGATHCGSGGSVIEIRKAMQSLGLTQQEAAKRMGITQPKVSDMMRGDFTNLSERKLMDCLTRLGYDIEIKVRPAKSEIGHLMLAAV
ncbi:MAG: hypothetical protein CVU30_06815 [Betaproteobacteria bacterium HGW-Betaproteobacteria-3]|jgi:predicted XRE-type DNA-binding protein|nr:MAG: hypothetical protein CVU30_06815 [Betaproteobacteria bacterium HGW-Betaproteobacteria-3]